MILQIKNKYFSIIYKGLFNVSVKGTCTQRVIFLGMVLYFEYYLRLEVFRVFDLQKIRRSVVGVKWWSAIPFGCIYTLSKRGVRKFL